MQNFIRGQGHSKALLNDNRLNLLHLGMARCDVKIKFIQPQNQWDWSNIFKRGF